ncbi:uncharacterized protein LOC125947182 [Dermacentor silvarum]|uniref:uncharacterized protein LOC125947182 n=1 Tax=Dermacentor silvarum TaxID=543639 RepID=UPI0021014DEA|nr:uncharacterized protein LOC125947182 [Dermacentor silvarum]
MGLRGLFVPPRPPLPVRRAHLPRGSTNGGPPCTKFPNNGSRNDLFFSLSHAPKQNGTHELPPRMQALQGAQHPLYHMVWECDGTRVQPIKEPTVEQLEARLTSPDPEDQASLVDRTRARARGLKTPRA